MRHAVLALATCALLAGCLSDARPRAEAVEPAAAADAPPVASDPASLEFSHEHWFVDGARAVAFDVPAGLASLSIVGGIFGHAPEEAGAPNVCASPGQRIVVLDADGETVTRAEIAGASVQSSEAACASLARTVDGPSAGTWTIEYSGQGPGRARVAVTG